MAEELMEPKLESIQPVLMSRNITASIHFYVSFRWIGTTMGIGAPKAHDLSLRYRAAEPVLKTRRADARVIARGEALIVQIYAEVECDQGCAHLLCDSC